MDLQKEFEKIKEYGSYKLADGKNPFEFYIGLDESGNKTITIRSGFKPAQIASTNALLITVGRTLNNLWVLGLHLTNDSMSNLFFKLCEDLLTYTSSKDSKDNVMEIVKNRLVLWKKMFFSIKKSILSEQEIMGLIGELFFLKTYLFNKYGIEKSLSSWSGCDKSHKDFSIEKNWYEVKTTNTSSLTLKISSIEQLDSDIDGFLVVNELEKMSEAYNGLTLNTLISEMYDIIPETLSDKFTLKLIKAGWECNDEYDKFIYRLTSQKMYVVNNDFPKIKKSQINSSIVKTQYEILKRDIEPFLYKGEK